MPLYNRWSNFSTSFQFKLFSIFTVSTFVIASLLSTLYIFTEIRQVRRITTEQLQLRAQQLGDSVRLPLYAENRDTLRLLARHAALPPEIKAVVISAPDGRILADYYSPDYSSKNTNIVQTAEVHSHSMLTSVESAMSGSPANPELLLGKVRLERGTGDLSTTLHHVILLSISAAISFWLSVSLLCFLVLRRVTRSFNLLVHGIESMQDGNFTSLIRIESDDEPGRAARAVNTLAQTLQQRSEENRQLHEEHLNIERQLLQSQKLESLGVMAGGIAHDFNNLLQAISGNMELASLNIAADSAPHKYINRAINSAKRAALLTNLMLTYLGKGLIVKKPLDLNSMVSENAELLGSATTTAVTMELSLSAELPPILADEAQIQQVVMNLITNAAESIDTQPGVIKLTTGTQRCDEVCLSSSLLDERSEPGQYVFLEVSDNGCGMSKDTLLRLFDPFFTTKFPGRGLGMSAVMGIIRTHNGALFVDSEPGKGTTFRVMFPAAKEGLPTTSAEPVAAPARVTQEPAPTLTQALPSAPDAETSGVALVVDDEKAVLRVCATMVKHCGFKVITACDGIDAVTKFREHADEITLVVMDLIMPNMDGIAAMGEIQKIKPDARIIISSGFNEEELSVRLANETPSGFIRKPYSLNLIKAEIQKVMQAG
ncbi:MAG: ATP-binding protein [Desulfuromonadaceae bacterium]|nr:ATP-binding protein [Desulfuromonadaceae bacterium]MDD2849084.1 ATP-binding protein [Desulfuromonadaceae bacterium]MDD4131758.1 ATP-binding protein [Desulfuromonadaceae bacterium]